MSNKKKVVSVSVTGGLTGVTISQALGMASQAKRSITRAKDTIAKSTERLTMLRNHIKSLEGVTSSPTSATKSTKPKKEEKKPKKPGKK